jgi:hypothetical protein
MIPAKIAEMLAPVLAKLSEEDRATVRAAIAVLLTSMASEVTGALARIPGQEKPG